MNQRDVRERRELAMDVAALESEGTQALHDFVGQLRVAARRALLAYDECGATISEELIDSMSDLRELLDAKQQSSKGGDGDA